MKNEVEHAFVVDYIKQCFASCGLDAKVGAAHTVRHGNVRHLRHVITAHSSDHDIFGRLLRMLNPTPALAGWPKSVAEKQIRAIERHARRCYAGYISFKAADGCRYAYVNLRSAHFGGGRFCLYTGGGITAQSNAEAEWQETEVKSLTAMSIIDQDNG